MNIAGKLREIAVQDEVEVDPMRSVKVDHHVSAWKRKPCLGIIEGGRPYTCFRSEDFLRQASDKPSRAQADRTGFDAHVTNAGKCFFLS